MRNSNYYHAVFFRIYTLKYNLCCRCHLVPA